MSKKVPLAIESVVKVAKQSKTEKIQSEALRVAYQQGWSDCAAEAAAKKLVDEVNAQRLAEQAEPVAKTWLERLFS